MVDSRGLSSCCWSRRLGGRTDVIRAKSVHAGKKFIASVAFDF